MLSWSHWHTEPAVCRQVSHQLCGGNEVVDRIGHQRAPHNWGKSTFSSTVHLLRPPGGAQTETFLIKVLRPFSVNRNQIQPSHGSQLFGGNEFGLSGFFTSTAEPFQTAAPPCGGYRKPPGGSSAFRRQRRRSEKMCVWSKLCSTRNCRRHWKLAGLRVSRDWLFKQSQPGGGGLLLVRCSRHGGAARSFSFSILRHLRHDSSP